MAASCSGVRSSGADRASTGYVDHQLAPVLATSAEKSGGVVSSLASEGADLTLCVFPGYPSVAGSGGEGAEFGGRGVHVVFSPSYTINIGTDQGGDKG